MIWPSRRQEGVTPPPLHRVPDLDRSDPKAMEASGEGLRVEASEGTGDKKAMEGGSHRGCFGASGGHSGWTAAVGQGGGSAQGGRGGRGRGDGG